MSSAVIYRLLFKKNSPPATIVVDDLARTKGGGYLSSIHQFSLLWEILI